MAENTNTSATDNANDKTNANSSGQAPLNTQKAPENTNSNGGVDNTSNEVTLTPEQWSVAFKHERFQSLDKKAKAFDKLQEANQKKEEEEMKAQNKFKELLESKEKENESLKGTIKGMTISSTLTSVAQKLGVVDTEIIPKLINESELVFDENGNLTNAEEVLKKLVETKPYLVAQSNGSTNAPANMGASKNPTLGVGNKQIWKVSELRDKMKDARWFQANSAEVSSAFKEGRVDYNN